MHIVKLNFSFTNTAFKRCVYLRCLGDTFHCGNDYCINSPLSNSSLHFLESVGSQTKTRVIKRITNNF